MNRQIFQGDVIEQLAQFPDSSIDVIISSPPYWGLRDYTVEGQLGLEPDFHDYLNKMQTIMDGLKRVLKNTGTCWINLGDTYSAETQTAKSRIGIPERFYINCIDGGWIARNHIVWTKNNSMPSSVKDRFKNSWESVFFFSKNKKYYFDLDAVREPTITDTKPFNARVRDSKKQRYLQKATDEEIKNHNDKGEKAVYDKSKPYAVVEREGTIYYRDLPPHDEIRKYLTSARKDANLTIKELEKKLGVSAHHWFEDHTTPNSTYSYPTVQDWKKAKEILQFDDKYDFVMTTEYTKDAVKINNPKGKNPGDLFQIDGNDTQFIHSGQVRLTKNGTVPSYDAHPKGKNPGDVFRINTKPFKEAHFATFPPDLPEKILKCACPKDGIVLDPFFGSGTVGLVAEQLGLQWCGIELNPEYIEMAKKRLGPYTSVEKMEAFT